MTKKRSLLVLKSCRSFLQGDTNKWELSVDISKTVKELQQNKLEAFKYMFANETKYLFISMFETSKRFEGEFCLYK